MFGCCGHGWLGGSFGLWGWFGMLFNLLVWIGIIWLVVWTVRRLSGNAPGGQAPARTPLDVLKERYARGEISREEFEQMKRDLQD